MLASPAVTPDSLAAAPGAMHLAPIDYAVIGVYFAFVLAIGAVLRRRVKTSSHFLMSGRSVALWITSLAFISANLGAQEVMGMTASGAKYGIMTAHFYWVGAIPAMVFAGHVHDAVLLRQPGAQRPRIPASSVRREDAHAERGCPSP